MKKRLQAIVDWVELDSRIVDIGSDHLIIPNQLIDQGVCSLVFATDVNQGPLESMRQNRLGRKIDIQQSDGLLQFDGEIDSAIIAGMGGLLIQKIIDQSLDRFLALNYLIVQPMQQVEELRSYLMKQFEVVDERLIAEDGKVYHLLKLIPGCDDYDPLLTKGFAPVEELNSYYRHQMSQLEKLLLKVPAEHQTPIRERLARLTKANVL